MPRRWKRYAALAAIVVMVARPELVSQTAWWLWEQRAERVFAIVTDMFAPEAPPPVPERPL